MCLNTQTNCYVFLSSMSVHLSFDVARFKAGLLRRLILFEL